jgi:chromosomal replication initiation ATPase DnaA
MRRPTVADVLEAVTYVAGVDPMRMGRTKSTMHSRRLAICALREIADLSWPEVALEMGYASHSTPMRLASAEPADMGELRAVLDRVSVLVGA